MHVHSELEWRELCSLAKFIFSQEALCVLPFSRIHVSINATLLNKELRLASPERLEQSLEHVYCPLESPRMSTQIM